MTLDSATSVAWRGWGAVKGNDADAAATLEAYFAFERATVFRRLLWRRLTVLALATWALEAFTRLPGVAFVITAGFAGTAGIAAFIMERRAHNRLKALLGCQMR